MPVPAARQQFFTLQCFVPLAVSALSEMSVVDRCALFLPVAWVKGGWQAMRTCLRGRDGGGKLTATLYVVPFFHQTSLVLQFYFHFFVFLTIIDIFITPSLSSSLVVCEQTTHLRQSSSTVFFSRFLACIISSKTQGIAFNHHLYLLHPVKKFASRMFWAET